MLIAAVIGYHFFAAAQAESQIDEAIQEHADKNDSISVQYSSLDIAPFSGTVSISDLTIIFDNHIERANHLQLDISYWDFLTIYFGGLNYGLDHLSKATFTAINPTYVNKRGLQEIKSDTLTLTYRGNALDGLQSAVQGTPFSSSQSIEAFSSTVTIALPKTTFRNIKAESLQYTGTISPKKVHFWKEGNHQFRMDSITWTPSESFQDSYRFFIKGFGYPPDALPFQSAHLHTKPNSQPDIIKVESSLKSELALFSSSGYVKIKTPVKNSELQDMRLRITDFSDSFSNVLNNIERFLSISIPESNNGISLQLDGTLSNPTIAE